MNDQQTTPASGTATGLSVATGSAPTDDITEDVEYQKFVESMVSHCTCIAQCRPCDGVLAGGPCDQLHARGGDDDSPWSIYDGEDDF